MQQLIPEVLINLQLISADKNNTLLNKHTPFLLLEVLIEARCTLMRSLTAAVKHRCGTFDLVAQLSLTLIDECSRSKAVTHSSL